MEQAKEGIWMPSGKVVCFECHGEVFPRIVYDTESAAWKQKISALDVEEENLITFCDECGQPIQIYDSIANEHNLVKLLRDAGVDAHMWQTGGMNSACGINKIGSTQENPNYYLVTYNMDGDDGFWLGSYKDAESTDDDFNTHDINEMVERIVKLPDVPRIAGEA